MSLLMLQTDPPESSTETEVVMPVTLAVITTYLMLETCYTMQHGHLPMRLRAAHS
jgi:hypothetical protein